MAVRAAGRLRTCGWREGRGRRKCTRRWVEGCSVGFAHLGGYCRPLLPPQNGELNLKLLEQGASKTEREKESERARKVAKKCHDKLWQKFLLAFSFLRLLLLAVKYGKIFPMSVRLFAKVCDRETDRQTDRLLLMHTKYLCVCVC